MQTKLADDADAGLIKLRTKRSQVRYVNLCFQAQFNHYDIQKTEPESTPKVAKITLNDCLACSGCITSAESILIEQQDYREAQRVLKENRLLDLHVGLNLGIFLS